MIRFRPSRISLSASVKEEQTFSSPEELIHYLYEYGLRMSRYIGAEPPVLSDYTVSALSVDNLQTGYRNERAVMFRSITCVGYCGE